MKSSKILYIASLLTLLTITSCTPTISNFDKYQKQFFAKTRFMPSKEKIKQKAPKVVVFSLDENSNQTAKQAGLGISIANNVENILSKNRLAKLVDRSAAKKLQKEIALSEMKKTGSYKGPEVADYAVSGSISNASFSSKYSNGSTYINPRSGQLITIPPRFTYISEVSGNLKIYELPSLSVIDTIEFSGKSSRNESVQQKGGFRLGGIQIGGEQMKGIDRDDGLVRKAGEDSIINAITDIKNSFAKTGYILEKRIYDDKVIFKINLGSLDGLKHGDKFEVIGKYESQNPITEEVETKRRIIAKGTISDKIDPKTSWIIIDDEDNIKNIRLGDLVKIKYEKPAFAWLRKLLKSF